MSFWHFALFFLQIPFAVSIVFITFAKEKHQTMRKSNYDKQPSTHIEGTIITGWDNIIRTLTEAWADIAAGRVTPHEEVMREWKEELAREEQEELELAEAV